MIHHAFCVYNTLLPRTLAGEALGAAVDPDLGLEAVEQLKGPLPYAYRKHPRAPSRQSVSPVALKFVLRGQCAHVCTCARARAMTQPHGLGLCDDMDGPVQI